MSEDLFFWRSPLFGLKNCLNLSKDLFWTPLFGQKNCLNLSEDLFFLEITSIWTEKLSQFEWRPFFFGDHLYLDRKSNWFVRQLSSQFLGKTLVPPKSFWAPMPMPMVLFLVFTLWRPTNVGNGCSSDILSVEFKIAIPKAYFQLGGPRLS